MFCNSFSQSFSPAVAVWQIKRCVWTGHKCFFPCSCQNNFVYANIGPGLGKYLSVTTRIIRLHTDLSNAESNHLYLLFGTLQTAEVKALRQLLRWPTSSRHTNSQLSLVTGFAFRQFLPAHMGVFAFQSMSNLLESVGKETVHTHLPYQGIWFA